jgi:putative transposase
MDWPHAPIHRLDEGGVYIVTCGTYGKARLFHDEDRLTLLTETIFSLALQYEWMLQAWSIFSNHYHFVAKAPKSGATLPRFLGHLHTVTAKAINELDETPGRKVWFNYWDTALTFEKSYLARLNYVHNNPVKHGLVVVATDYRWCSARWFEQSAEPAFYRTVSAMKTDTINVPDPFQMEG